MKTLLFALLTIVSSYSGGAFRSEASIEASCSRESMNIVMDSLLADFARDPGHLFYWAFYGTGVQDENAPSDAFILQYDSVIYIPKKEQLNLYLSVLVPHFKDIHGIVVEARLTDNRRINGVAPKEKSGVGYTANRVINFRVKYSGKLLKDLHASLTFVPDNSGKQRLYLKTYCEFGTFFNLFISQKMYRNVVEWRLEQFLLNLQRTAEGKPLRPYPGNKVPKKGK